MKFRKKPIVIEAFQLPAAGDDNTDAFFEWAGAVGFDDFESDRDEGLVITTLEGDMRADPGDWIIKGVKGEFYPCKPDIFAATYEAVTDAAILWHWEFNPSTNKRIALVSSGDNKDVLLATGDNESAWLEISDEHAELIEMAPKRIFDLEQQIAAFHRNVLRLDRGVSYERREDMSPEGRLAVIIEDDGDIIVTCRGVDTYGEPMHGSVQFCTPGSGGGKSPKTRAALLALAAAIIEDNGGTPEPTP